MVALNALALTLVLCGAGETVLLEFSADWCGPCRMMEPTVRRLLQEGYPVRQVNIDRDPQAAARFRVTGVPCFIMLADGQEVDRVVGPAAYARLVQMVSLGRSRTGSGSPGVIAPPGPGGDTAALAASQDPAPARVAAPQETDPAGGGHAPALPAAELQAAIRQALEATVRLKVEDSRGHSLGTGTVIDAHGPESLVATCGHLFRESAGKGRILVDVFAGGTPKTVDGQLISCDLNRDIALVSILPQAALRPVRVAPAGHPIRRGAAVFSVGCDQGQEPRVEQSRITAIDKYLGAPNIEVAGQPVDGRSGGGLFSLEGYLIGICNAADPADHEGIYASLPAIHWELDRVGLRAIYQPEAPGPGSVWAAAPPRAEPDRGPERVAAPPAPASLAGIPSRGWELPAAGDTEVICIVRTRGQPQGHERLYILDRPSPDFLDQLARATRRGAAPPEIALQPVDAARSPAAWPHPGSRRGDGSETVRAQSSDR